jgi:hypothetical protein
MSGLLHRLGFIIRETGQALDVLGCKLAGSNTYLEDSEWTTCMSSIAGVINNMCQIL